MCPLHRFRLDAWNPEGYHTFLEPHGIPPLTTEHVTPGVRHRHGCRSCSGTIRLT